MKTMLLLALLCVGCHARPCLLRVRIVTVAPTPCCVEVDYVGETLLGCLMPMSERWTESEGSNPWPDAPRFPAP